MCPGCVRPRSSSLVACPRAVLDCLFPLNIMLGPRKCATCWPLVGYQLATCYTTHTTTPHTLYTHTTHTTPHTPHIPHATNTPHTQAQQCTSFKCFHLQNNIIKTQIHTSNSNRPFDNTLGGRLTNTPHVLNASSETSHRH